MESTRAFALPPAVPQTADSTFGERSASTAALPQLVREPRDTRDQDPPAQIDRYSIIRRIGRGGFGTVYLVHDPVIDRRLALKVGHFRLPQRDGVSLREARLTARVQHPNVVTVYDAGEDAQLGQWIAMEFVEGQSLADLLRSRRSPLPLHEALRIGVAIAEGVHSAHQQGLLHRDLKPANVLLGSDGRTVKVADFGLALSDQQREAAQKELTGTLSYMSPEQVRGDVQRLDARSDIWSLGVILYEMLAAARPFSAEAGPTGIETSQAAESTTGQDISERILHRQPPPLAEINPGAPRELAELCSRCLAKDPALRPQNAEEVAAELRKLAARAAPHPRRAILAAAAAAGLVLMGGGSVAAWSLRRSAAPRPPDRGEWISLLDREPRRVVWDQRQRSNRVIPVPQTQHRQFTSSSWGLLSYIPHESAGCELEISVASRVATFYWGVLWSLRPDEAAELGGRRRCRALLFDNLPGGAGRIRPMIFEVSHDFQITPHYLSPEVPLAFPPATSAQVAISVLPDGAASVMANGATFLIDSWRDDGPGLPAGEAGLIVSGGTGVFHQFRFRQP